MRWLRFNYIYHACYGEVRQRDKEVKYVCGGSFSLHIALHESNRRWKTDNSKHEKNETHITGKGATSRAIIACVCVRLTVHVEMEVPGKSIETRGQTESQHQLRLGSLAALHSI